jgi:phosphoribosylaminoimidazolecarboxamide formyltransferase/IMP cyclohydrolase
LSYNNLVDLDAALQLLAEFPQGTMFAIIKHTNVCGVALGDTITEAWEKALAGDPESAFGGVLATQTKVTIEVAEKINQLFFEILVAPSYEPEALELLKSKKNRILLQQKQSLKPTAGFKSILHGILVQEPDITNLSAWKESGGRTSTPAEKKDLEFGNIVCKHLKSNAIALVKNGMLIGKGCGQTSRIDALRQAIDKARQTGMDTQGAVLASDAFFPFDDCARMAKEAGITAIIQPGGSIRDQDTINYCQQEGMVLVLTGTRHFRH